MKINVEMIYEQSDGTTETDSFVAEVGECIAFHEDGVCTCGTFKVSCPDIEDGKEFFVKSHSPLAAAEKFVSDHDDGDFADYDMKIKVKVIDGKDVEHHYTVCCAVEYKYCAI